jgi:micrococcal nuclease
MARLMRRLAAVLAVLLLAAAPATAQSLPDGARVLGETTVASVVDGDTVVIDPPVGGADQVRLVGLQAPKLALGRVGFEEWPLAPEAKAALEALVLGRGVALYVGGADRDRHGRILAHLVRDDGLWVQGRMLARGWARVYSFPDNRWGVGAMLALERAARAAGLGMWAHADYAVRAHTDLAGLDGTFQLVEGRVRAAATVKGRAYLNFGSDWKSDFTVTVEARDCKRFEAAGLDPDALGGTWVRVARLDRPARRPGNPRHAP